MRSIKHGARLGLAAIGIMLVSPVALAQDEGSASAIESKIRALAPAAGSIAISETPIDGLLQVQVSNEIYYASSDARYLVIGRIMDLDTRENITDQAKAGLRKDVLDGLDRSQQISFSPAAPEYELLVFTDIDCGYCRKLHEQIDEYMAQGIAINYMAFPRAGVASHSYDKFVSVWCADDQQAAITLAKSGAEPEPQQCENPISDQYELGRELGVTGTPALVTSDGGLIPGYVPPAQLKERLIAMKAPSLKSD